MDAAAKVTSKGQVTVPKAVRDALGALDPSAVKLVRAQWRDQRGADATRAL